MADLDDDIYKERLTRAEMDVKSLSQSLKQLKDEHRRKMDKIQDTLEEILVRINDHHTQIEQQKSFIGGIAATWGVVFAIATFIVSKWVPTKL